MKIVHSDDLEAREGGSLTVVMEESDDLWVLYNLVDPDDTVRCGTPVSYTHLTLPTILLV